MGIKQSIDRMIRIIIPLFYTMFILCGFISALASGLVEYHVFKQFFYVEGDENIFIVLVPLLIVIVFEVTKIFLVFFKEQLNENVRDRKNEIDILRRILIFISILSTIIFTTSKMENPEKEKVINAYISPYDKSIEQCQRQLTKIDKNLDDERKTGIKDRYTHLEKERREYTQKCLDLQKEKNIDDSEKKQRINDSQASDNQAISKFLSSMWRILDDDKTYPRELYYLFVLLFSLLLSIGLEIVIITTAYVIYNNHPNVLNFDDNEAHSINFIPFIKYTMFAILFMAMLTLSENINQNYLPILMFLVGVVAFFISRKFISDIESPKSKNKEHSVKSDLTPAIIGALVPLSIGILLLVLNYKIDDLVDPFVSITVSFSSAIFGEKLSLLSQKNIFKS